MDTTQTSGVIPQVQKTRCASEECLEIDSNDDFAIEFLGHKMNGDLATFAYEVRRIRSGGSPYYWVLALHQMTGLAEGKTLRDFVVGATRDNAPISFSDEGIHGQTPLGWDPPTQLDGFRFDGSLDVGAHYTITFDTSVLQEGCILGTGRVLAATKAGSQDIRNDKGVSPGYLCIIGPVCACVPPVKTCETAFAFAGGRARRFLEFQIPELNPGSWGYTNGPFDNGIHELEIRAAPGPYEPDRQILVGMLYVFYHANIATVVYEMDSNYTMEEVHLYVGSEPLPRDAQGNITVDPMRFPYTADELGGLRDHMFVVYNLSGPIHVVAHAVVCWQE